jgi:hypothetical protein
MFMLWKFKKSIKIQQRFMYYNENMYTIQNFKRNYLDNYNDLEEKPKMLHFLWTFRISTKIGQLFFPLDWSFNCYCLGRHLMPCHSQHYCWNLNRYNQQNLSSGKSWLAVHCHGNQRWFQRSDFLGVLFPRNEARGLKSYFYGI